jgi:hypothetical protein
MELADLTLERINTTDLRITDKADWASICEERTKWDIRNLKIIRNRII